MSLLITSIVASIVLTLLANDGLRMFSRRSRRNPARPSGPGRGASVPRSDHRTPTTSRVFFPWKLMVAVSLIATIAINVIR